MSYDVVSDLWRLVVFWHHCDVEADASDCFAKVVGHRENKLDVLGVGADVHDGRHVGYFHEVHCVLETCKTDGQMIFGEDFTEYS